MTLRLSALRRVKRALIARHCLFRRYLWKKMAGNRMRRTIEGDVGRKRIHLQGIFRIHHWRILNVQKVNHMYRMLTFNGMAPFFESTILNSESLIECNTWLDISNLISPIVLNALLQRSPLEGISKTHRLLIQIQTRKVVNARPLH